MLLRQIQPELVLPVGDPSSVLKLGSEDRQDGLRPASPLRVLSAPIASSTRDGRIAPDRVAFQPPSAPVLAVVGRISQSLARHRGELPELLGE